jgi:hypothetical protein
MSSFARSCAPPPTTSGRPVNRELAVFLPESKSLPLGDADLQPVGIKLQHRGFGDPGIGHQLPARRVGIEEEQRRAAGDAGGSEHILAADLLLTGQRNGCDVEADGIGAGVSQGRKLFGDDGKMPARDRAISQAAADQQRGSARPRAARQMDIRKELQGSVQHAPKRPGVMRGEIGKAAQTVPATAAGAHAPSPFCPSGPVTVRLPRPLQRFSEASSTIHCTSSSNVMPACAASSGTSDVSVMPGCVLTSRQNNPPVPSTLSS